MEWSGGGDTLYARDFDDADSFMLAGFRETILRGQKFHIVPACVTAAACRGLFALAHERGHRQAIRALARAVSRASLGRRQLVKEDRTARLIVDAMRGRDHVVRAVACGCTPATAIAMLRSGIDGPSLLVAKLFRVLDVDGVLWHAAQEAPQTLPPAMWMARAVVHRHWGDDVGHVIWQFCRNKRSWWKK